MATATREGLDLQTVLALCYVASISASCPLYCPQISAFFPGHHMKAMAQNAEMRKLEGEVAALLAGAAPWCAG